MCLSPTHCALQYIFIWLVSQRQFLLPRGSCKPPIDTTMLEEHAAKHCRCQLMALSLIDTLCYRLEPI
jgi:hypothetical protein